MSEERYLSHDIRSVDDGTGERKDWLILKCLSENEWYAPLKESIQIILEICMCEDKKYPKGLGGEMTIIALQEARRLQKDGVPIKKCCTDGYSYAEEQRRHIIRRQYVLK